jgi:hypothetical protein
MWTGCCTGRSERPPICPAPAGARSFDIIYEFSGAQLNVANAAPGDTDYNGGRWMVHLLTFPSGYGRRSDRR